MHESDHENWLIIIENEASCVIKKYGSKPVHFIFQKYGATCAEDVKPSICTSEPACIAHHDSFFSNLNNFANQKYPMIKIVNPIANEAQYIITTTLFGIDIVSVGLIQPLRAGKNLDLHSQEQGGPYVFS